MRALLKAVRAMQVLNPELFKPGPARLRGEAFKVPRPPLLSQGSYAGLEMNDIVAPPRLAEAPLESWREWFNEICADYLYASATDIRAITTDIAGRAQLNRKQRAWLLPLPQAVTAQGASILLAFCLYGAVRAGAQVQILTKDSFVVEKDGSSWGVRAYSPAPGEIGPLFNYLHYMQGNVRWGSTCRNGNLVRAFKEARKQGNKEAMHILQACYWNTPDTWAMDSLFTTGT